LVVGAGPVGLFTAVLLAESGIRVKVIDQESRTTTHSHACALHPRTLRLLDLAGVAADLVKRGQRIDTMAFYQGKQRRAELRLADPALEFPFMLVVPQSALEEALEERLSRMENVEVDWNHRLADVKNASGGAVASIEKFTKSSKGYIVPDWDYIVEKTTRTSAEFVVGADGSNSHVRQCLGIEYEPVGAPESYVVYDFASGTSVGPEMRVVLDEAGTSVMWPFSSHRCRWSFQTMLAAAGDFSEKDRSVFQVEEPADDDDSQHRLQRLLERRAPWFEGNVQELDWSTEVQFGRRLARQFGQERCWLVGDAAHQTGPIGTQSMNIGFCEAAELAKGIRQIVRDQGSLDLLQEYGTRRRAEWQRLLGLNGGLKATDTTAPWVREHSARFLSCLPASGVELKRLVDQLGLDFP
jgi:2-polyprenyl-6-methoxyphenol hydroxylase-like FAD-dependent oxidoreductase